MRSLYSLFVLFLLVTSLHAQQLPQRFDGSNPNPVHAGSELEIVYADPNLPDGTKVTVDIVELGRPEHRQTEVLDIRQGVGRHKFKVPSGWLGVVLKSSDSMDKTIICVPPSPEQFIRKGDERLPPIAALHHAGVRSRATSLASAPMPSIIPTT